MKKDNIQAIVTIIASVFVEVIPNVKTSVTVRPILKVDEVKFLCIFSKTNKISLQVISTDRKKLLIIFVMPYVHQLEPGYQTLISIKMFNPSKTLPVHCFMTNIKDPYPIPLSESLQLGCTCYSTRVRVIQFKSLDKHNIRILPYFVHRNCI